MHIPFKRTAQAAAIACAAIGTAQAQDNGKTPDIDKTLPTVTVTAAPFASEESAQILAPAKVLSGDELRNKLGSSLGETLINELGVSTSGFGNGASRPIIRGLGGPRVRIMQNGMGVSDVSTISEDHAVAGEASAAHQVEILRGPASLLYGSGAIGGLVNIVNDRIPTTLGAAPTGEADARYGTADRSRSLSLSADGAVGKIGLHVDGNVRNADDYKIPEHAERGNPDSPSGRLPLSFTRQNSLGFGASYVDEWGYVGASVGSFDQRYGVSTDEGSTIDLSKKRYDVDAMLRRPFQGIESARFRLGYTDYEHTEIGPEDIAETRFNNKALESRLDLAHGEIAGWRGTFGVQNENSKFSARSLEEGESNTVPETKSNAFAGFLIEEKNFGPVRVNAGLRLESVKREPVTGRDRSFDLSSYSIGGLWAFAPGYAFGPTFSIAQRAPSTEELYSGGPHHATETFDRGSADLDKETSRNIELGLQKTSGLVRWKANLFHNRVKNFIYGRLTGEMLDDEGNAGGAFDERIFSQDDATIRGAEAEISYNQQGSGFSARAFADTSRGRLENTGNLPLQPATRYGLDIGYKQGPWSTGATVIHALRQDRIASFETQTPSYTKLDANLSYTHPYGSQRLTWFVLGRNLLNEDIRLSTSLLKDTVPLQGRSFIFGVRTLF